MAVKTHLHRDYHTAECGKDASYIAMTYEEQEADCVACATGKERRLQREAEAEAKRAEREAAKKAKEAKEREEAAAKMRAEFEERKARKEKEQAQRDAAFEKHILDRVEARLAERRGVA